MSTWTPLIWSAVNVLLLILGSFSIQGGLQDRLIVSQTAAKCAAEKETGAFFSGLSYLYYGFNQYMIPGTKTVDRMKNDPKALVVYVQPSGFDTMPFKQSLCRAKRKTLRHHQEILLPSCRLLFIPLNPNQSSDALFPQAGREKILDSLDHLHMTRSEYPT